jgi:hypothetical protein
MAEGRRPVEGKASRNACSGLSAGLSMSLKQQACGSLASTPTIAFDLRREPGAGKLHAGICGGGVGQPAPLPDIRALPGRTVSKSVARVNGLIGQILIIGAPG